MNDSTNRPRVLLRALGLIAFVAISFLTVKHIGLAIGANHTKDALVLLFAFMLLASSRLAYFGLLLPLSLLLGAYYPVAMAFGKPSPRFWRRTRERPKSFWSSSPSVRS